MSTRKITPPRRSRKSRIVPMTEREKREIQAQKALARAEVERLRVLRERDSLLKKSRIDAEKAARESARELRAAEREAARAKRELRKAERIAEQERIRERIRAEAEEYARKEAAKSFSQLLDDVRERYEAPVLARDSKGRYLSIKKAKEAKESERDAAIRSIAERFGIPRNEVWHQYFSPTFK